MTNVLLRMG